MRRRYREGSSEGRKKRWWGAGMCKKLEVQKEGFFFDSAKKKKKNVSGDSFNACLLFFSNRLQPQGRVYPQASPAVGIYSSSGLPANKTHVDLPRNGEGLGSREQPASVSQKKNKKKTDNTQTCASCVSAAPVCQRTHSGPQKSLWAIKNVNG